MVQITAAPSERAVGSVAYKAIVEIIQHIHAAMMALPGARRTTANPCQPESSVPVCKVLRGVGSEILRQRAHAAPRPSSLTVSVLVVALAGWANLPARKNERVRVGAQITATATVEPSASN